MAEWCDSSCRSLDAQTTLQGVIGDEPVHSCGKPSFVIWQEHEKYCDECGRSFSSPWETLCEECCPGEWVGWERARQLDSLSRAMVLDAYRRSGGPERMFLVDQETLV